MSGGGAAHGSRSVLPAACPSLPRRGDYSEGWLLLPDGDSFTRASRFARQEDSTSHQPSGGMVAGAIRARVDAEALTVRSGHERGRLRALVASSPTSVNKRSSSTFTCLGEDGEVGKSVPARENYSD